MTENLFTNEDWCRISFIDSQFNHIALNSILITEMVNFQRVCPSLCLIEFNDSLIISQNYYLYIFRWLLKTTSTHILQPFQNSLFLIRSNSQNTNTHNHILRVCVYAMKREMNSEFVMTMQILSLFMRPTLILLFWIFGRTYKKWDDEKENTRERFSKREIQFEIVNLAGEKCEWI